MSSNVAARSTSNEELNSIVDKCNELASFLAVCKRNNEAERVFH